MKEFEITTYPFTDNEKENTVRSDIHRNAQLLFENSLFDTHNKTELLANFSSYFKRAEFLFQQEEAARKNGETKANLYYHNKHHAVYQTTHDAIVLTQAILARNDAFSSHLTAEGAYAIVLGAMYHDTGYVTDPSTSNYAGRTPVHVEYSMRSLWWSINKLGLPDSLDYNKVKELGMLGIHATHFPHTEKRTLEAKKMLNELTPQDRKEAHIVRLAIQFADLGGQTARIDYFPHLVKKLRAEMNASTENSGTNIIGTDEELDAKCRGFINFVVKETVGKSGNAIFKEFAHPYFKAWIKNGL